MWALGIGFLCSVPWAGHQSVGSPACQDQVAGGHAGVGVVSPGGAPLSLPSFVTLNSRSSSV